MRVSLSLAPALYVHERTPFWGGAVQSSFGAKPKPPKLCLGTHWGPGTGTFEKAPYGAEDKILVRGVPK